MNKDLVKVLLVEDDAADARLVERLLAGYSLHAKFAVESVGSLSEAIECLTNREYDIVLADLGLPDSNGIDTVRKVREVNPRIPIVVLTGLDDEETGLLAIKADAVDYLVKGQQLENMLVRTLLFALERKKAQEQLKVSKASFHNIVEKSTDGIIVMDKDGVVQFVNHAAEALFGRKAEKLVGELLGFPIVDGEVMELDVLHQAKEPGIAEMRVVDTQWNEQPAYLALLRDITARKKAEEKLKETMIAKSEFTSTVSHELRTPLTAIKEGIALVVGGLAGEVNEEQKEILDISKKNVDRLARLINDVLDFQKLESGKMKFDIQPNSINELARDVYEMMAPTAKDRGAGFLLELDDSLSKTGFDSDKITQVLTNLVTNAMKFTEKGNITIKTGKKNGTIHVSVSDTGHGIKKEDLPRVFDRFEQLATGGERKTGGTGLGLAISKNIIEQHDGRIWVESTFGKGSKFTFTLPVYSTEELFRKYVNDGIKEASRNDTMMSLIFISIADFNELKQKLSHEKIASTLKDMEALLENSLRGGGNSSHRVVDTAFKLSSEVFVVLPNCGKENIPGVRERLEQKLDDYLADKNLADKIRLLFGCATYPDDAATSEELIKKAKELRPMVSVVSSV